MLKVSANVHIIWKGNIKKQMTGELKRLDCLSVTLSWLLLLFFFPLSCFYLLLLFPHCLVIFFLSFWSELNCISSR